MSEALVVGGGIAGLAAAVGLVRRGWDVRVLDRAAGWSDAGAAISLAPNGLRALDTLDADLGAAVRAAAAPQWSGATRRPDGTVLAPFDGHRMAQVLGDTLHAMPRAELHRLLLDALPADVVETTAPVLGVDVATGRVHRTDATTTRADLVVAADGVGSVLRTAVVPGARAPVPTGYTVARAIVDDPGVDEDFSLTWGPGLEAGHIRLPGGRVEWHVQVRGPEADAAARVARWHPPLPALLAASSPGAALRHEVRVLPRPLPRFVAGRVVLVGDAAHPVVPNLGQGGCQALEDAAVLAACLDPAPVDDDALATALRRHDSLRRPRTRAVARSARGAARAGLASHRVTIAVRDTALTRMPWRLAERVGLAPMRWDPPGRGSA